MLCRTFVPRTENSQSTSCSYTRRLRTSAIFGEARCHTTKDKSERAAGTNEQIWLIIVDMHLAHGLSQPGPGAHNVHFTQPYSSTTAGIVREIGEIGVHFRQKAWKFAPKGIFGRWIQKLTVPRVLTKGFAAILNSNMAAMAKLGKNK